MVSKFSDGNKYMRLFRIRTVKVQGKIVITRENVGLCGVGKCWLAAGFAIQVYLSGGAR